MDLSKVFDCLPHNFKTAKLNSYGFNLSALKLILNASKMEKAVDNRNMSGAFLMHLSKRSECLSHNLLTAKSISYGFTLFAFKLINNHLSKRKQRI